MKTLIKIMALLLSVAVMFTGCLTQETTIKIDETNNTMTMNARIEVDRATWVKVVSNMEESAKEALSSDEMIDLAFENVVKNLNENAGYTYSINKVTKENKEYYVVDIQDFQSIEQYNKVAARNGNEYISTEAYYGNIKAVAMDAETANGYKELGVTEEDFNAIKYSITVEFPNKIVSYKNGTISEDNPNVITFEYGYHSTMVLFATTNKNVTEDTIKKDIEENYMIKNINGVKKPSIRSVKVTSVKKKKGTVKIKIKTVKNATYEVQYSTNKKFKKAKTKKTKKATVTIKKLKAGKKYYFRVRAVAIPKDNYVYKTEISKYSKKKAIIIKKKK